jgi:hypothetical protein
MAEVRRFSRQKRTSKAASQSTVLDRRQGRVRHHVSSVNADQNVERVSGRFKNATFEFTLRP